LIVAKFSATAQTEPAVHPASCKMGNSSFSRGRLSNWTVA